MSAGQLSAGAVFEVKCLFAIDAIAAVYRAEQPRFEHAARTKWYGHCYRYWRRLERRVRLCDPAYRSFGRRKKPPGRRPPAQARPRIPSPAAVRFGTFLSFRRGRGGAVARPKGAVSCAPQWLAATPLRPANLRALGKIENVTRGGMSDASKSERRLGRGRSDSLADKADRFGEQCGWLRDPECGQPNGKR